MELVYIETAKLIPYANNTRTHSKEQVKQIASSINEFGFTNPVLIDGNNGIIAGHGRVMASELLQIKEVPCIILDGLTETQKKAYIIADNKLALNAGWDEELLKLEIEALQEMNFDIDLLGFNEDELRNIFDDLIQEDYEESNLKEQDYKEKFEIIIECESELQQEELFYNLTNEGYKCRVQSL